MCERSNGRLVKLWRVWWRQHGVPADAIICSRHRYADFWAQFYTGRVRLSALVKYVAVCVRAGIATSLLDLPDVLLQEDWYLDMFDLGSYHSSDMSDDELVEVP